MSHNYYIDKIRTISIPNKYTRWYINIIEKALNRASTRKDARKICGYVEEHHILPRAFKRGGYKDKSNYSYLTAREHFICHLLLAKMVTDERMVKAMINASWLMCHSHLANKRYRITSRIFENLKKNSIKPCPDEVKEYLRELHTGKKRDKSHIHAMKKGWQKLKEAGTYTPHNKGISGVVKIDHPITLISPEGQHKPYRNLKEGCDDNNLIYTKMSAINSGSAKQNNGWTINGADENYYTRDELLMFSKNEIVCKHCGITLTNSGHYSRWHGNNCKLNHKDKYQL